jgi:molybdopterin-guanine dinucleotide biosynthesis protein B
VAQEASLDDLVSAFFADMDLVLTEGYMRAEKPQIEVFRSTAHQQPLHTKGQSNALIAVMSDVPVDLDVPNFDINDITALADLIETRFLSPRKGRGRK